MLFEEDNHVLKIRRLCKDCDVDAGSTERLSDLMVIQCNASNVHGYTFGQGYLNVLSKSLLSFLSVNSTTIILLLFFSFSSDLYSGISDRTEIFVGPPENREFTQDEKELSLECRARTDEATELKMTWYKGSDPISSLGDDHITIEPDNTLFIDMHDMDIDQKSHYQDHYRCEATNTYSTASATSNVIVEGAPLRKCHINSFIHCALIINILYSANIHWILHV